MKVSYEKRFKIKDALSGFLRSYGAPLGLFSVIALAALYVFSARGSGPLPAFPRSPEEFVRPARAQRRLAELAERLRETPDDIKALDEAGRLKFQLGEANYVAAISDLERARALGLADPRAFYYLGVMYQAVGLYEFAAQEYRKFLNNFPKDAETRMLLAKLYYAAGDHPGAAREYEALRRDGADDPVLLENLALALRKAGREYTPVLEELRGRGAAGAFLADYAAGRIKYEDGNYAVALPLLRSAASAAPAAGAFADQASLFWMAADCAYRGGEEEPASLYLRELLKVSPGHEEGRRLLARIEKARAARTRRRKN